MFFSPKICVLKETKDILVNAFNMITNKNEAKAMVEHVSGDRKCKFNNATYNSKQNGIMKHVSGNVKIIISAKKTIVNCNCYGYCIYKKDKYYSNKKDKYYSNKCYKYCFNKIYSKKVSDYYILNAVYYYYAKREGTI